MKMGEKPKSAGEKPKQMGVVSYLKINANISIEAPSFEECFLREDSAVIGPALKVVKATNAGAFNALSAAERASMGMYKWTEDEYERCGSSSRARTAA